jgi:hypothetical protein
MGGLAKCPNNAFLKIVIMEFAVESNKLSFVISILIAMPKCFVLKQLFGRGKTHVQN